MKTKPQIILILSFILNVLNAQPHPIEFANTNIPKWSFVSIDTNYVHSPTDKWSTPYWGRNLEFSQYGEEAIYFLEMAVSQSPYGGLEGSLIHKLDRKTGLPIWTRFDNAAGGQLHRESYLGGAFVLNEDKTLDVLGIRNLDTIDFTRPSFFWNGNPIHKVIDAETGTLLSEEHSKLEDDSRYTFTNSRSRFTTINQTPYLLGWNNYLKNDSLYDCVNIFSFTPDFSIDYPNKDSIEHNTKIKLGELFFSIAPLTFNIDENHFGILFFEFSPEVGEIDINGMSYYNVEVNNEGKIIKVFSKELNNELVFPNVFSTPVYPFSFDEDIILLQGVDQHKDPSLPNFYYWVSWLDKMGNRINRIPQITVDGYNYTQNLWPIGIINGDLYLHASFNDGPETQNLHILKLGPTDTAFVKAGEISFFTNNILRLNGVQSKYVENGEIFFGFRIDYNDAEGDATNFNYYSLFDVNELGITNTKDLEDIVEKEVTAFPNPASKTLNIKLQKEIKRGVLTLVDVVGNIHYKGTINGTSSNIQIESLPNGVYFVKIADKNGQLIGFDTIIKQE